MKPYSLIFMITFYLLSFTAIANDKPNIVLIMTDDLGHDDLSMHGNKHIETPSIDALANNSVQFSDFSVTPVCSTSRAAMLTGQHPYKVGVSGVHGGRDFLKLSQKILPEYLKDAGYRTGMWGKWHVGKSEGYFPWNRGFDEGYYAELYRHKNSTGWLNGEYVEHNDWVSKVITDYAINFIDSASEAPFFAYLNYLAPHEPWDAPKEYVERHLKEGQRPAIANLYGMIEEMDAQIGRLMEFLEEKEMLDNTLVIFLSDNGPWWNSSNYGAMLKNEWLERNPSQLKGFKGQTWQNGIKSPLFFHFPEKFEPTTVSRFVNITDILPTLLEFAGVDASNAISSDGISFLPYLNGDTEGDNPRTFLVASHALRSDKKGFNQWSPTDHEARINMDFEDQLIALRNEQYKLLLNPSMSNASYPKPTQRYLLFDMQNDPLETTNLYNERTEIAQELKHTLLTEFKEFVSNDEYLTPPIYKITADKHVNVVNGFGPTRTMGGTRSAAHKLSMKSTGDSATYSLEVEQSATYLVVLEQENTNSAGLRVLAKHQEEETETLLNGSKQQLLGAFELEKGNSDFTISIVGNESMKSSAALNGLRRLLFLKKEADAESFSYSNPF